MKLKRRNGITSKLQERSGDPHISYPNDGSWSQQTGVEANVSAQHPRYLNLPDPSTNPATGVHPTTLIYANVPFPKGYYKENIGRPSNPVSAMRQEDISQHTRNGQPDRNCTTNLHDSREIDERDMMKGSGDNQEQKPRTTNQSRSSRLDKIDRNSDGELGSLAIPTTSRICQSHSQKSGIRSATPTGPRKMSYTPAAQPISTTATLSKTSRFSYRRIYSKPTKRASPHLIRRRPDLTAMQQMVPSYDDLYN